jgi:hypothetical protein
MKKNIYPKGLGIKPGRKHCQRCEKCATCKDVFSVELLWIFNPQQLY